MKIFNLLFIVLLFASCGIVLNSSTTMVDVNTLNRHEFEFKKLQIEYPTSTPSREPSNANNEVPLCEQDNRLIFYGNSTYAFCDNTFALCAPGNRANTVIRKGNYYLRNVNSHTDIIMQQTFPSTLSPITVSIAGLSNTEFKYSEPITSDGRLKMWIFKVIR